MLRRNTTREGQQSVGGGGGGGRQPTAPRCGCREDGSRQEGQEHRSRDTAGSCCVEGTTKRLVWLPGAEGAAVRGKSGRTSTFSWSERELMEVV